MPYYGSGVPFCPADFREGAGVLKIVKADNLKWQDKKYKKQVLEECEKMAAFYPSYLKEQAEKKITLSPNALKVLRLQAEGYLQRRLHTRTFE